MHKSEAIFAKDELTVGESGVKIIPAEQAKKIPLILASMDEVKSRLQECESAVRQQGYDEGYAKGITDGSQALLQLLQDAEYYYQSNEKNIIELVVASIHQVLGDEIDTASMVTQLAIKALKELRTPNSVTIYVHPDVQGTVQEKVMVYRNELLEIRVETDQTLNVKDCKLDTQFGSVDASLATQLQAIENTFYMNSHDSP